MTEWIPLYCLIWFQGFWYFFVIQNTNVHRLTLNLHSTGIIIVHAILIVVSWGKNYFQDKTWFTDFSNTTAIQHLSKYIIVWIYFKGSFLPSLSSNRLSFYVLLWALCFVSYMNSNYCLFLLYKIVHFCLLSLFVYKPVS